jgi:hypothetical protein
MKQTKTVRAEIDKDLHARAREKIEREGIVGGWEELIPKLIEAWVQGEKLEEKAR